ncbi:glycosyl hydrolases family 16 protein [Trichodelitschia bisporula]|uniref:chitinase n=1 Tax=Trichodelitschia bisporula TaxID=703511 RepID=A0A6G1HRF3_9PEZI|nr:glycosyl hydrolases family 16 protein [Trichodelitschia bisporula]
MARRILLTALCSALAAAQTWTYCNPLNTTCPANPALGGHAEFDFTKESANPKIWNMTAGPMKYGSSAEFTIHERGQSPTIQSNFFIFFGRLEVMMQAAAGTGIISTIVLQSDDLDEVDWEIIGGNRTHVESNFFGKGNTTSYDRAIYHPVDVAPQDGYHNYTVDWTKEKMEWYYDGHLLRTLRYDDPLALWGKTYPQTPMNVRLGIWSAGDESLNKYTIEWAGGLTDWSKLPFTMLIKGINVTDYSTGSEYTYGDHSGSWQSIKIKGGNSTAMTEINKPVGVSGRWNALSSGTRAGIVIGAAAGFVVLIAALLGFCIVQGRAGRKEKAAADAKWEEEQKDLNEYRLKMMKGGFSAEGGKY